MAVSSLKIGILSIGDMGMGIAKLLIANSFTVVTNCRGRSADTIARATSSNIQIVKSDEDLVTQCSVILSVVPPRDAISTAQRIIDAAITGPFPRDASSPEGPLYFADLNAIAPSTVRQIDELFTTAMSRSRKQGKQDPVKFVDGCIIGAPPSLKEPPSPSSSTSTAENVSTLWTRPSIPLSGPHNLDPKLSAILNTRHISPEIGAASGLKMCFASLSKGFTALAIQSFTTASRLGVLSELKAEMEELNPNGLKSAIKGVVGMAPKAYRWVREMEEIALCFEEDGGFEGGNGAGAGAGGRMGMDIFKGVAGTYKAVAEETVLGEEKVGKRKRGLDVEDMAKAMGEGLEKKKKKND